tara:strand:- start:3512 stop:6340 length:2829 start_codon:yes stop_codon:yes gene_type:complete
MEKAARQKDEKQVQTYIEACDVGAAAACTKAAQLGRNIANQKYILNAPEIAVLLEKGCREGGEAECLAAAGAAELKARWTLGDDFQPEQASPDTGYEMAVLGCERGWAQLCFTAADQLSAGITLPPNFDAAATYYDTACRLGQTKACERAELFNGTDADAFAATKERANLIWQSKSYLMAIDLPDDHPARVIARKQYSAKTTREKTQYQLDACNAGDPKSCFELGFALEQQISYSDAPAGVNKRELLMKACALGSSQGCQSAARLTKYAPLRYAYYDNSRDLYERACLKMANPVACDEWGEWIEAEGDIDADAQLVRSLYRKSCLFRNKMDTCEKLDAFEQKMTPERVAARMATKQALAARKRVVPFAAYDICAGPESAALGRAVDAGNGAAAFTDFVKRCGGEYARPQLKAACERLPDAPSHHKLLCSAVLMEFKADESITAGSWSVSGTQLSETFRVWPSETYLDRSNMGHIANALNPDAPLQTAYSGPVGASLFPEIEGLAEVRTAVGQNAFRLVLQDRGFVILSPVDPVNTTFRNGVYSVYVFKEGATPEGYTAGEGEFPDQIGAARMEHRAAWDEAAGKWQVETASFFEIPWGDDWQDIAQGRLYAFLAHGKETSGANGLCCGSSLFIPFEGDTLTAHALQRTTMASLYGGTITPDVAQAMRIALNDSPETPLWSSRCGERPYVSTGGMGFEDFDNMVDDYSLRREKNALKRRIAWYDCQQDAFNNQLAEVNAFLAEYRAKPPTDPMRWRAALMLSRFEAHRGKLESEADTLDSYSATIGKATSQYNAEQRALRRAARAERQATQSGNSAADDFYYRNSGAYYSACLSNAQSYGQQQGCMDQWLANTDSARAQRDAAGESHGSESAEGDSGFYDVVEPVLTYEKIPSAEVPEAPVSTYQPPEPEPLPPPKKPLCPEGYNCNCGPTPIPKSEIQASCR